MVLLDLKVVNEVTAILVLTDAAQLDILQKGRQEK